VLARSSVAVGGQLRHAGGEALLEKNLCAPSASCRGYPCVGNGVDIDAGGKGGGIAAWRMA
jgi:hypothetical protein